jgi:hypothetical protein
MPTLKRQSFFFLFLTLILTVNLASQALAATAVVGTCKSGPRFSTIQQAVDAITPGGTVLVCPGVYPEQVVINRSLTLKAVVAGSAASAVIISPPTGLVSVGIGYAAHILVQATDGPVTISGIAVDGSGTPCPVGASWMGIVYASDTSGTVTSSVVRNLVNGSCSSTAVHAGLRANLKIQNNSIHNVWSGISDDRAASLTIMSNNISNVGFGIGVGSMSAPLTISNNVLSPIVDSPFLSNGVGIRIGSNRVSTSTVTGNTISGTNIEGIQVIQSAGVKITANRVIGAYEGVSLTEATTALVQNNTIVHATAGLIVNDNGSAGGNVVMGNKVNEASCGIWAPITPVNTWLSVDSINCYSTGIPPILPSTLSGAWMIQLSEAQSSAVGGQAPDGNTRIAISLVQTGSALSTDQQIVGDDIGCNASSPPNNQGWWMSGGFNPAFQFITGLFINNTVSFTLNEFGAGASGDLFFDGEFQSDGTLAGSVTDRCVLVSGAPTSATWTARRISAMPTNN